MFLHLSVILFTGGGCVSQHALGIHPLPSACWDTPALPNACWDTHPPPAQCMLIVEIHTPSCPMHAGIHTPSPEMATAADSMHPTGMQSCSC